MPQGAANGEGDTPSAPEARRRRGIGNVYQRNDRRQRYQSGEYQVVSFEPGSAGLFQLAARRAMRGQHKSADKSKAGGSKSKSASRSRSSMRVTCARTAPVERYMAGVSVFDERVRAALKAAMGASERSLSLQTDLARMSIRQVEQRVRGAAFGKKSSAKQIRDHWLDHKREEASRARAEAEQAQAVLGRVWRAVVPEIAVRMNKELLRRVAEAGMDQSVVAELVRRAEKEWASAVEQADAAHSYEGRMAERYRSLSSVSGTVTRFVLRRPQPGARLLPRIGEYAERMAALASDSIARLPVLLRAQMAAAVCEMHCAYARRLATEHGCSEAASDSADEPDWPVGARESLLNSAEMRIAQLSAMAGACTSEIAKLMVQADGLDLQVRAQTGARSNTSRRMSAGVRRMQTATRANIDALDADLAASERLHAHYTADLGARTARLAACRRDVALAEQRRGFVRDRLDVLQRIAAALQPGVPYRDYRSAVESVAREEAYAAECARLRHAGLLHTRSTESHAVIALRGEADSLARGALRIRTATMRLPAALPIAAGRHADALAALDGAQVRLQAAELDRARRAAEADMAQREAAHHALLSTAGAVERYLSGALGDDL